MREIDKTIILMASRLFNSINIFVLSIFFARMLLKSDYGTYIQFNMIIGLLVLLLSLGIPPSLMYFLSKNINKIHLIKRTLCVIFGVGFLNIILLYSIKQYIADFINNQDILKFILLAGFCIVSRMISNLTNPVLIVIKKSVVLALTSMFKSILLFSTMLGCLFFETDLDVLIYVLTANYGVEFFVALWVIIKYSNNYRNNFNDVFVSLRVQFKYSIPLAMSGVLWLIGREIDKYIVSHYLNPEDLAVYARGAVEIPLVSIFAATIAQVYLPNWVSLFDKKEYANLLTLWHLTITKTALIMFPVFVIFQIVGYDFIVLMYSSEYSGSVPIFMVYLFLVPLQITQYTAIVESSGKPLLISIGYVFQIGLNILFSVILIKKMGSIGPAFITVVTMYLWVSYILLIISRILKVSFINVFPWYKLIRLMIICLAAGVGPLLLKVWIEHSGVLDFLPKIELVYLTKMIIIGFLFLILYMSLLFITKTLDDDDRATIYRWMMVNKIKKLFGKSHA